ncbi:hypothetical protein [Mycobacterium kyorinense]|nr:hypothetical protein [Mycobacterium kyorinense]
MTDPKPKIVAAIARLNARPPKLRKVQRLKQQRQIAAWQRRAEPK